MITTSSTPVTRIVWQQKLLPVLVAIVIALCLFLFMLLMIRPDDSLFQQSGDQAALNFIRVKPNDLNAKTKDRRLPDEPPPAEPPPPTPELNVAQGATPQTASPLAMNLPSLNLPMNQGNGPFIGAPGAAGGGIAAFDSDVIPVVQIAPNYPRRAKLAKLQGSVTLAVTIRPDGSVADAEVIEAEPKKIFDEAAVTAMLRWKFRPKIVDGQPQAQRARQTIEFTLN